MDGRPNYRNKAAFSTYSSELVNGVALALFNVYFSFCIYLFFHFYIFLCFFYMAILTVKICT